jgi:hypothetical protein
MKGLKFVQKFAFITTILICMLLLLLYWYKQTCSMEATHTNEVNLQSLDRKLLIVTQGSPFKDSIAAEVMDRYKSSDVIIEVTDVKTLANVDAANFDAILFMYRWEAGAPPASVQTFMDKNSGLKNKMVILITSWNGLEKTNNVDAITGASIVGDAPIFTNKIIKKLDRLLKYKK